MLSYYAEGLRRTIFLWYNAAMGLNYFRVLKSKWFITVVQFENGYENQSILYSSQPDTS